MTEATSAVPALDEGDAQRIIDACAPLLGLSIEPAWRVAISANLKTIAAAAQLVAEIPLPDELEPAPVFCA